MTMLLLEQTVRTKEWPRFEIVERKGQGHPDSICDGVVEEAARALARAYLERFGRILHFNLDKALLAAGASSPRFGGGTVEAPMRFIFGDRAAAEYQGQRIAVAELMEASARTWLSRNVPRVDLEKQVTFQSEVRAGSAELTALYEAQVPGANDTSTGVGFWPLTETERLVMEAERHINEPAFKERFPETGEDVKVMGVRRDANLELTVALAFVDRFINDEASYFRKKRELEELLLAHLRTGLRQLDDIALRINTLDEPGRGERGTYLTVSGTSAESADSGEVGRGNGLLGFTSATRPWSAEAVAGKNPLSHVGKIYNHLAQRAAERIAALDSVAEASVFLVSRIGGPLDAPQFSAVRPTLRPGAHLEDVRADIEATIDQTLSEVTSFVDEWLG